RLGGKINVTLLSALGSEVPMPTIAPPPPRVERQPAPNHVSEPVRAPEPEPMLIIPPVPVAALEPLLGPVHNGTNGGNHKPTAPANPPTSAASLPSSEPELRPQKV